MLELIQLLLTKYNVRTKDGIKYFKTQKGNSNKKLFQVYNYVRFI